MTTVSVTQLAAVEPSLHHVSEDHEEGNQTCIFELHPKKTCLWVFVQVQYKPGCTNTEDG